MIFEPNARKLRLRAAAKKTMGKMREWLARLTERQTAARVVVIAGIGIALAYSAYVAAPFIRGPILSVSLLSTTRGTTMIVGQTRRVSTLTVNDREIPIAKTGDFVVEQSFPTGYTVVIARARDRFGRTREEILAFIVPPRTRIHDADKSEEK